MEYVFIVLGLAPFVVAVIVGTIEIGD